MSEPCMYQQTILKHGEELARQGQSIINAVDHLKSTTKQLDAVAEKLSHLVGEVKWQKTLVIGVSIGVSACFAAILSAGKAIATAATFVFK